jgi:nitroimidazol reductase NimA-like FMN-containing flavoprotein (pyridoxamine 5'-phosphate oxidase superfamily)
MLSKSVICKGEVIFIEDLKEKEAALNILMKNYSDRTFKYSEPAMRNVKVWKILVAEMTGKAFGEKPEIKRI